MGRLTVFLLLLTGLLAACGKSQAPEPAAQAFPAPKTAVAEIRDIALTTSAEAVIEAVRQSTVSAQIAGRIVDLRFDVGDYVKKGQVIARIDERAVSQAEAASVAQVNEAQAALANARAQYERSKQLLEQKFISQAALDKAQSEHPAAFEPGHRVRSGIMDRPAYRCPAPTLALVFASLELESMDSSFMVKPPG